MLDKTAVMIVVNRASEVSPPRHWSGGLCFPVRHGGSMDPVAPGYAFATGSLGLGIHGRRLRDLGPGFDPHAQLPSVDPDLDLMHLATLVLDSPLASSLATVIILYGGLRASGLPQRF